MYSMLYCGKKRGGKELQIIASTFYTVVETMFVFSFNIN